MGPAAAALLAQSLEPILRAAFDQAVIRIAQTVIVGEEYAIRSAISDALESMRLDQIAPELGNLAKIMKPLGDVAYLDNYIKQIREANQSLGISGELTRNIETNVFRAYQQSVLLGIEQDKIVNSYRDFYASSSRNVLLTTTELVKMAEYMEAYGQSYSEIFATLRLYGQSIEDTADFLQEVQRTSNNMGLNTKKVLDAINLNMTKLDSFSFKNGIDGLSKMVLLSERYKFNMSSTDAIISNFLTLDKVFEASANLMTLGGDLAAIADPFTLMATARSNPEKLMESIFTAAASYATRGETGYEIDAYGMDMIREYAKITGASTEDIARAAKLKKIEEDVATMVTNELRNMQNFDEVLSKISGSAFFKDGILGVNIQTEQGTLFKAVQDLNKTDLESLNATGEGNDLMKDLLVTNRSALDTIKDIYQFLERNLVSEEPYQALSDNLQSFIKENKAQEIVDSEAFQGLKKYLKDSSMEIIGEELPNLFNRIGETITRVYEYNFFSTALSNVSSAIQGFIRGGFSFTGAALGMMNNNSQQSFSQGGIISAPTTGLIGEYPEAKRDPEVVSPLSKLEGILSQTSLFQGMEDSMGTMNSLLSQSQNALRGEQSRQKVEHSFGTMSVDIKVNSDGSLTNIDTKELSRKLSPVIEDMIKKGIRDENVNEPRYNPVGKTMVS
jgi:DNA-binding transcriptional regulator YhcF (GntR family)